MWTPNQILNNSSLASGQPARGSLATNLGSEATAASGQPNLLSFLVEQQAHRNQQQQQQREELGQLLRQAPLQSLNQEQNLGGLEPYLGLDRTLKAFSQPPELQEILRQQMQLQQQKQQLLASKLLEQSIASISSLLQQSSKQQGTGEQNQLLGAQSLVRPSLLTDSLLTDPRQLSLSATLTGQFKRGRELDQDHAQQQQQQLIDQLQRQIQAQSEAQAHAHAHAQAQAHAQSSLFGQQQNRKAFPLIKKEQNLDSLSQFNATSSDSVAALEREHSDGNIQAVINFHDLVSSSLVVTRRGRDFKALGKIARERMNSLPKGCKNIKHKVKSMYGERRRRRQIECWKHLITTLELSTNASSKQAASSSSSSGDLPETLSSPNQPSPNSAALSEVMRQWFPSPLFNESVVNALSEHVIHQLSMGYESPGSILSFKDDLRDAVVNELLRFHKMPQFGSCFPLIHRHFEALFSPAEVEMAILFGCDCATCHKTWNLAGVPRRRDLSKDPTKNAVLIAHFRAHYTREKASWYSQVLQLHVNKRENAYEYLDSIPKCKGWPWEEFQRLLKTTHNISACPICLRPGFSSLSAKRRKIA